MIVRLLLFLTITLCNSIGYAQQQADQWRVLPVLSKRWKTSLSLKERVLGHISEWGVKLIFDLPGLLNFKVSEHEPLYHLGAPSKIFIIDYIDSKIKVNTVEFERKGTIPKCPGFFIAEKVDPKLMFFIRQTTGIDNPYGDYYPDHAFSSCSRLLEILLDEQVCIKLNPKHCVAATFASMEHPFVFIASHVTDEMLINELKSIHLEDFLAQIWFSYDVDATKKEKVLNHYRTRYAQWRKELDKLPEVIDSHLMVCIEDIPKVALHS